MIDIEKYIFTEQKSVYIVAKGQKERKQEMRDSDFFNSAEIKI